MNHLNQVPVCKTHSEVQCLKLVLLDLVELFDQQNDLLTRVVVEVYIWACQIVTDWNVLLKHGFESAMRILRRKLPFSRVVGQRFLGDVDEIDCRNLVFNDFDPVFDHVLRHFDWLEAIRS